MREIDPKKVPDMMLNGELRFGMELEFSDNFNDPNARSDRGKFIGFDIESRDCFCMHISDCTAIWYSQARFPLLELRDGDPVIVHACTHRHFHSFHPKGINCYPDGTTPWTGHVTGKAIMLFTEWRLPTKQELELAGYTEDQISELESRGCIKT